MPLPFLSLNSRCALVKFLEKLRNGLVILQKFKEQKLVIILFKWKKLRSILQICLFLGSYFGFQADFLAKSELIVDLVEKYLFLVPKLVHIFENYQKIKEHR